MKLRESGMPGEVYWETLFDVERILDRLGIANLSGDAIELGCGYGTFTLSVAQRISGMLRTYDIDPFMVERTLRRASDVGIENVRCELRDVVEDGFGIPPESQEACLLFNILHCEDPIRLLKEGVRSIRPTGSIYVIHWKYDPTTPRGPTMSIRPRPEQIRDWALVAGLSTDFGEVIDLPPYHYGMVFRRG